MCSHQTHIRLNKNSSVKSPIDRKVSKMYIHLFIFNLIFILISHSQCEEKVLISAYIEYLCPDSRRFVNNQLSPTYQELSDIMDIEIVPFGKSNWTVDETSKQVTFKCQHGPQECYGNKIQVSFQIIIIC